MMIVLDTSVLVGLGPDSPAWDLLRVVRLSGCHRVAVPWMVREELVARRVLEHQEAHLKAEAALRGLARVGPWMPGAALPTFDVDAVRAYWRDAFGRLFEIIETSGDVARRALAREAYAEKPAKTSAAKKGGARDAAIWLSAADYAHCHPGEKVCFVSSNTHDFGDGQAYPVPMAADIEGAAHRLVHLTSIDALLGCVAKPAGVHGADLRARILPLLSSPRAVATVRAEAERLLADSGTPQNGNDLGPARCPDGSGYRPVRWRGWATVPLAVLREVGAAEGYEIGGDHWYTADADWYLLGVTMGPDADRALLDGLGRTVCRWRTRLLLSAQPGVTPAVARHWPALALKESDRPDWEPVLTRCVTAVPEIGQVSRWALEQLALGGEEAPGADGGEHDGRAGVDG